MRTHAAALLALFALATSIALPSLARAETSAPAFAPDDDEPTWAMAAPTSIHADGAPAEPAMTTTTTTRSDPPWIDRPLAVQGAVGFLGGPTGLASLLVDYRPTRWFGATVGLGLGGDASLQYAASARLRLPIGDAFALSAGGGLSGGAYTPVLQGLFAEGHYEEVTYAHMVWGNVEVALETESRSGFFFRGIVGHSSALAFGPASCAQYDGGKQTGSAGACRYTHEQVGSLPYVYLAFGKSFSL